jgi:PAS domain S-box-containing protein
MVLCVNERVGRADALADLLAFALEISGIGVFHSRLDGQNCRFSSGLCALLGVPSDVTLSSDWETRLGEGDCANVAALMAAAGEPAPRIRRITRSDGSIRWVSVRGHRIPAIGEDCQPEWLIGAVVDVTDLKESENALRESERRLRLALDAAQVGTFDVDLEASQAVIDAQEARLLGLPEGTHAVSVDELRRRVPFEDLQASDVKQRRLTEGGEAYRHEFRLNMPDGSERWLGACADIRADRIFGVTFDITERKRFEEALCQSEARLRLAANGAALGVFEWDTATDRAIWQNDRMYEIFGRDRNDPPLGQREFADHCLHPDDTENFNAELKRARLEVGRFYLVCRARLRGGLRWLQIDGRFDPAGKGENARFVGVVADITRRNQLEKRAQALSERVSRIQEEERRTIAQELHDSTVQHLVAANLTAMRLRSRDNGGSSQLWDDLEAALDEASKELRTFSYLLHPPKLRNRRLYASISDYAHGFARRCGIELDLRASRDVDRLPVQHQKCIFRIVQEGLANVYRHASASRATVELRWMAKTLHIIITDNGAGLRSSRRSLPRAGVGIGGIRSRLRELGGDIRISRAFSGGTRVHAVLRVSKQEQGAPHRTQPIPTRQYDQVAVELSG